MAKNLFPLIAKRIDSIPTLPLTLKRFRDAAAADRVSDEEIVALVESDPALTAQVLKVINSPFYGLRARISTLSHGIAMLGRQALLPLAEGIPAFSPDLQEISGLDKAEVWVHAISVALAAREIAVQTGYDLPEEAYTAGLLHDFGRLVLDQYAPEGLKEALRDGEGPVAAERRILGMNHAQVGALVAEQWSFPRILKDVIQHHHEAPESLSGLPPKHRDLVAIVSSADALCRRAGSGHPGDAAGKEPLDPPDQGERVLRAVEEGLKRTADRLDIEFGSPAEFIDQVRHASHEAEEATAEPSPVPDLAIRMAAVPDLIRRARRAPGTSEMLGIALDAAQGLLTFDRLLYLELNLEEQRLRGRHLFDDTLIDVDVGRISIPLNPDGLVGMAFRGREAQLVDNWATDGDLLGFLGVVEVAAAPVIVREQPHGFICGDTFLRNTDIPAADVALLGLVAGSLSLAIENQELSTQCDQLKAFASKDELTGVDNRRTLMNRMQREIERTQRYGGVLSLVMVDIDHFKEFNDRHGHLVGDEVLRETAQLIVANSRGIDVIGRYGGEEFLVVLPETDMNRATVYAERVRSSVERLAEDRTDSCPISSLSISVGVTTLKPKDDNLMKLIQRADTALLAAKQRGRNRVCVG